MWPKEQEALRGGTAWHGGAGQGSAGCGLSAVEAEAQV